VFNFHFNREKFIETSKQLVVWILIALSSGAIIGSIVAFFLKSLNFVTAIRNDHHWIILGLPLAGLLIGYSYYRWGGTASKGNLLLIESIRDPKVHIPFKMSGMILFSTLLTHLFGGSAGREGTAVQIGGALTAQWNRLKQFSITEQRLLLYMGIAAGFSAVFGTPIAGTIFALELVFIRNYSFKAVIPCLLSACIAYYTCELWGITHTHYALDLSVHYSLRTIGWIVVASCLFGLTVRLFVYCNSFWKMLFEKITFPPLRPLIGGSCITLVIVLTGAYEYSGLGIPTIQKSFLQISSPETFILKLLLTTLTISAGFKGGEVTPLFFIGATLGSALSALLPIPTELLAGIGFVTIFAGASKTPIACTVMGMELFGIQYGVFLAMGCIIAYFISGKKGIYTS
jgi:H+/Cl- antiporter ClcA